MKKKIKKLNNFFTIKGFVVPWGYMLRITQDNGEVLEKTAGEQSGGQYSFEQVLQGIDPGWELVQVGGYTKEDLYSANQVNSFVTANQTLAATTTAVSSEQLIQEDDFVEVLPDPDAEVDWSQELIDLDRYALEGFIDDETLDYLAGTSKKFRDVIGKEINEGKIRIEQLDPGFLSSHPKFDELGGYMTKGEYGTQLSVSQMMFSANLFSYKQRYGPPVTVALVAEMREFWETHVPLQIKEREYDNDFDVFFENGVKDAGYDYGFVSEPEPVKRVPKEKRSWYSWFPSFMTDGMVSEEDMERFIDEVKHEEDAIAIISSLSNEYYNNPPMQLRHRLMNVEKELENAIDDMYRYEYRGEEAPQELQDKIRELQTLEQELKYEVENQHLNYFIRPFRAVFSKKGRENAFQYTASIDDDVKWTSRIVNNRIQDAVNFVSGFVHPDNIVTEGNKVEFVVEKTRKREGMLAKREKEGLRLQVLMNPLTQTRSLVHELGHAIEDGNPSLTALTTQFLQERIGKDETCQRIRDMPGYEESNYEHWEVVFEDNFISPYVGKVYWQDLKWSDENPTDTSKNNKHYVTRVLGRTFSEMYSEWATSTEVISMGIDEMYADPMSFAEKDPHMFSLIWRLRQPQRRLKK